MKSRTFKKSSIDGFLTSHRTSIDSIETKKEKVPKLRKIKVVKRNKTKAQEQTEIAKFEEMVAVKESLTTKNTKLSWKDKLDKAKADKIQDAEDEIARSKALLVE